MDKHEILKNILSKNFIVSQRSNEKEILIKCPYCGDKNDDHHIKTGHFHMYINIDNGSYHCFLCNKSGHNIQQFIKENKNKFTNRDIIILSKLYYFNNLDYNKDKIYIINKLEDNKDIKNYINYFYNTFLTNKGLEYLYKRIYIKENDNKEYLQYLIQNKIIFPFFINKKVKMCKKVKESFIKIIKYNKHGYLIPFTLNIGFQLHFKNNNLRYITFSDKNKLLSNMLLLKNDKSNNLYIVEGIFDGLKLWNILNKKDNVLITFGKSNISSIILLLKYIQFDYRYLNFIFAFDNDINYNEYLKIIKRFKYGYSFNNIKILKIINKDIKDIGEIISKEQFYSNTEIIDYNIFSIKNIYTAINKILI